MSDSANSNDVSAQFYDAVYNDWADEDLTNKEVDLIISLIPVNGNIMDLGCGTGRHLIKIAKKGVDITGVDLSANMLRELKKKYSKANVLKANIFTDSIDKKFDLITIIWNGVMEIAYTDEQLHKLFSKLHSLLNPHGKILIVNLYNEDTPAHDGLNFTEVKEKDGQKYRLTWTVKEFDKQSNTTICEEKIELMDKNDKPIQTVISDLKQKWWRKDELDRVAQGYNFTMSEIPLSGSNYHYYLFQ